MSNEMKLHPKLTECKLCKSFNHNCTTHPTYKECRVIQCCICGLHWYVCVEHNKRFNINNHHKLHSHFLNEHSIVYKHESINISYHSDDTTNNEFVASDHDNENDETFEHCQTVKKQKLDHASTDSLLDLWNDETDVDKVLNDVIGTAFTNNEYSNKNVSKEEISFHLNLTSLCNKITESQQVLLIDIIYQLMSTKFDTTRPPTTHKDLQKFYLTGRHSIYQNIPCPIVLEFDNHACVSIKEIIKYSLITLKDISIVASAEFSQTSYDNSTLLHTMKAKKILSTVYNNYKELSVKPYVIFITLWSDDFEVNQTRKNRNSTWIKTMSLIGSKLSNTSRYHTHLIALGNKGCNHANVNARINEELLSLQGINYYYVKQYQATLPIVVHPLVVLADRPERCTLNSTLSYAGNSTRRWLYSSLVTPQKLSSCKRCFDIRINRYIHHKVSHLASNKLCGRCCDFNYIQSSKAAAFLSPSNYPCCKHVKSPSFPKGRDIIGNPRVDTLRPIQLTYEILTSGTQAACFNLITKQWKVSETRSYLKNLGVSSSFINTVIEHVAQKCDPNIAPILVMQSLPLPHVWIDGLFELDQFIETPMHHLFEGIIKSLLEITMDFLKHNKQWKKYCGMINPILEEISSIKLDFCHVEGFWQSQTDYRPTGWIAENYLGYSRLMVYLLIYMETLNIDQERGYLEFNCMIQSAFVLVSHLMTRRCVSPNDIDDIIKIFLYSCNLFDTNFGYGDDNVPFWYKKSNFVSLLNLPNQIRLFGPVYLHWEGVKERYIQFVKPMLKNKRRRVTYLCTKFQQILQNNAIDIHNERYQRTFAKRYHRHKDIIIFASKQIVEDKIKCHESLPVIIKPSHPLKCYLLYKQNDMYRHYNIKFDDDAGFHKCNLWFSELKINEYDTEQYDNVDELYNNETDEIGLLVCLKQTHVNSQNVYGYALISSDWCIRTQDDKMELPSLSKQLFQTGI